MLIDLSNVPDNPACLETVLPQSSQYSFVFCFVLFLFFFCAQNYIPAELQVTVNSKQKTAQSKIISVFLYSVALEGNLGSGI